MASLPPTMKALVSPRRGQPLELRTVPTPVAIPGSVVVNILAAPVDPRFEPFVHGKETLFTIPDNLIPGGRAVGRVVATGDDAARLAPGQLVLLEPFLHARDDPDVVILFGFFDGGHPASQKLAANWTNGVLAEYCRAPLENCHALDEAVLCRDLGYAPHDLAHLAVQLVPYAGLRSIDLQAGETVAVAPATGEFSGAAVQVAVAMGATVVALGRDAESLARLQATFPAGRVRTVVHTGNAEADTASIKAANGGREVDAFIDISPPASAGSTHIRSCFAALRRYGRASLMGFIHDDVALPYAQAVFKSLTIKGLYMYEREQVRGVIKLAESGALKVGKAAGIETTGIFGLEEKEKAIEATVARHGILYQTVLAP